MSSNPTTAAATYETWAQHRVGKQARCDECDQEWPCDIAKAWRHGYQWAQVKRKVDDLSKRPLIPADLTEQLSHGLEVSRAKYVGRVQGFIVGYALMSLIWALAVVL